MKIYSVPGTVPTLYIVNSFNPYDSFFLGSYYYLPHVTTHRSAWILAQNHAVSTIQIVFFFKNMIVNFISMYEKGN